MTVFVTGATGVLGRPVVRMLRNTGHSVRALSRSASNDELLTSLGAEPVDADLFDAQSMTDAMDGCEAVLHLATKIPATADLKKPGAWDENDRIRRDGTKAIVDAGLRHDSVRTVLYAGISFFYGDNGSGLARRIECGAGSERTIQVNPRCGSRGRPVRCKR